MDSTRNEKRDYGKKWNDVHDGYFSDLEIAAPFILAAIDGVSKSNPDVIADLGGGTGFLVSLLKKHCRGVSRFYNVDVSEKQLSQTPDPEVRTVCNSLMALSRNSFAEAGESLMFCTRSTFHYFGREGYAPLLEHLRSNMRRGEIMIQQTACFSEPRDRDILNLIYEMMGTDKWYPLEKDLESMIKETGWHAYASVSASPIRLSMEALRSRYMLEADAMKEIRNAVLKRFGESEGVFTVNESGFDAYLHYRIITCEAV